MRTLLALTVLALPALPATAAEPNLLRNGSFEGGFAYWYGAGAAQRLVEGKSAEGGAAEGQRALRLDSGFIWSASFVLAPKAHVTISASVRAVGGDAKVRFFLVPNSREAGVEPFRLFWGASGVGQAVTSKEWTRVSWQLDLPGADFQWRDQTWWDRQGWFLFPTGDHVEVDAITVTTDGGGATAYVGEDRVDVATNAAGMPDAHATFNLLDPAKPMAMATTLHNPGTAPLAVRWQHAVLDYTGERQLATAGSGQATLAPGETRTEKWNAPFAAKGLILARTTVTDAAGTVLGRSDRPLTSLAFPQSPTAKTNLDERFGYSLNDLHGADRAKRAAVYDAMGRIGFRWSRWHPHCGWSSIQPGGADQWNWPDDVLDDLAARGCSATMTLNGIPDWAKGSSKHLPKDMEWGADDPRWDDLSLVPSWDRFVRAAVTRWGNGKRSVVWEIINEPLWEGWDPKLYTRFIVRTSKVIRSIDPKAQVMIDGCYGLDELHRGFLANGGAAAVDQFSFHNYGASGWFTTGDAVRGMRDAFAQAGHPVEVLFNEGWTHWPSSADVRAWSLFAKRSPTQVVHEAVSCTADAVANGLQQVILFNTAHDEPGRSWWDWGGDGNVIWDDAGDPTVAVGAFNVMADQLGLAKPVATVRASGALIHIFDDRRNRRGVAVAWSTGADRTLALPIAGLQRMDVMGNAEAAPQQNGKAQLVLAGANRPWYVFAPRLSAAELAAAFKPFEQPDVLIAPGVYGLPLDWLAKGKDGNPYRFQGKPIWRVGRVYPPQLDQVANYRDFTEYQPAENRWADPKDSQGGHPSAGIGRDFMLSTVAAWQNGDQNKPASLFFVAPTAGLYELDATANANRWTGDGPMWVQVSAIRRPAAGDAGSARVISRTDLAQGQDVHVAAEARLAAGEELVLTFGVDGMFTGAACRLPKLAVRTAVGGADQNRPKR